MCCDDEDDFNARGYGNGNVIGPDKDGAKHGTHGEFGTSLGLNVVNWMSL